VAAVLTISAAITLLGVHEKPARGEQDNGKKFAILPALREAVHEAFRIDLHVHRSFAWLIFSRLLYLAGIYGIQTFAQYYVRDVLAVPNPIQLTGDLLAAITVALMFFALGGGWVGDRIGHKRMSFLASLTGALGCLLLLWARTPATLLVFGTVVGAGIGLFLTANWALANKLSPADEAGKFLGLTNLATAGAGALGRLEGPLIDYLNNLRPGAWWGYTGLFLVGFFSILASAWVLCNVSLKPSAGPSSDLQPALN
jgi:MFS family permease